MHMHTPAEYVKNAQDTCQKAYSLLLGAARPILHYGTQNEAACFFITKRPTVSSVNAMTVYCFFQVCLCREFSLNFDITHFVLSS